MRFGQFTQPPPDAEHKLVGFLVGDVRYGVDIMQVREIVNPGELVQVPAVPPYVVGVTDHREAVVPVVDLRLRFGLDGTDLTRRTKWIIAKAGVRDVGLQVDRVSQVLKMTLAQQRDRGSLVDDGGTPWIRDVYADTDGLVFELDLDAVIAGVAELPGVDVLGSREE